MTDKPKTPSKSDVYVGHQDEELLKKIKKLCDSITPKDNS